MTFEQGAIITGATETIGAAVHWLTWNRTWQQQTQTATTITTNTVWCEWCGNHPTLGTTSAVTSNVVWQGWIAGGQNLRNYFPPQPIAWAPETEEQRVARAAREAAADREVKEARKKAVALLDSCLSPEQRTELLKRDYFHLETVAPSGERRRYRIDRGTHGNVKLVNASGTVLKSYCAQPDGVPVEDSMLAQKLLIEHDEAAFLRVANAR